MIMAQMKALMLEGRFGLWLGPIVFAVPKALVDSCNLQLPCLQI